MTIPRPTVMKLMYIGNASLSPSSVYSDTVIGCAELHNLQWSTADTNTSENIAHTLIHIHIYIYFTYN